MFIPLHFVEDKYTELLFFIQESRQNRVDSWLSFQAGSSKGKTSKPKKMKTFKPPKPKPESR